MQSLSLCRRLVLRLSLIAIVAGTASAQTLARPGWAGSGMSLEPWWTHAIFYQVDPHGFRDADGNGTGDLRGLTSQLDYIHSLGVDAITLTHFQPEQGDIVPRSETVDPSVGSLDDFDDLIREASRDSLRLIVELGPQQISNPTELATIARFWLGRGAAGISLRTSDKPADPQQLRRVHEVTRSFAGQRILISESGMGDSPARHGDADLVLDPALATVTSQKVADLRGAMEHLQNASASTPLIAASDGPGMIRSATRLGDSVNSAAAAKVMATLLLATRANAQLYYGQEIGLNGDSDKPLLMPWGTPVDPDADAKKRKVEPSRSPEVAAEEADPDSLLTWYRRLIDLHHGNAILRSGTSDFLNHDDQNSIVWVSRKGAVTPLAPAIVVACNLSAKSVTLSLTSDLQKLHLRGNFLRTVIRSDNGMGGLSLDAVILPPFGIYIGEVRF